MANQQRIILRFTSTPLTSLTYNAGASDQYDFLTVSNHDPKPITEKIQTTLLNGNKVSHIANKYLQYQVRIAADEIGYSGTGSTKKAFLADFWNAQYKYLCTNSGTDDSPTYSDYILVDTEPGLFPLDYVEDYDGFPEIELTLTTMESS